MIPEESERGEGKRTLIVPRSRCEIGVPVVYALLFAVGCGVGVAAGILVSLGWGH